ncbi:MAG: hypothetical protein ACTHMC_09710 [Pseudobacter sp.]
MKDPGATQGQPGGEELNGAQPAETAAQEQTTDAGATEDTGGQPEPGE